MNKIILEVSVRHHCGRHANDKRTKSVMRSLPFFKSRNSNSKYFHRVRSAENHWWDGKLSHTSVAFWCGGGGFLGESGRLHGEITEGGVLCAVCEGKAIGAGLDGARVINGRAVMFKPREDRND